MHQKQNPYSCCSFLCLLFLCAWFVTPSSGQQPVFQNFSVKDGLPSSEVYKVMQDTKGYMWFCTDAGISRYDGYSFTNYSKKNGLSEYTIFGCAEDSKGRIWFRSMSGRLFYFKDDSIYSIKSNEKIAASMKNGLISSIYVDAGDTVWCGVIIGEGFCKIAPPYRECDFTYCRLVTSFYTMEPDGKGLITGSTTTRKKDPSSLAYHVLISRYKKQGLTDSFLAPDAMTANAAYVKKKSGGILVAGGADILELGTHFKTTIPGNDFISCFEDNNGQIWAGKSKDGVYLITPNQKSNHRNPHYLKAESVTDICEDREGGLWFTTLENGAYHLASPNMLYFDESNGLKGNTTLSLLQNDHHSVLAGMSSGEIFLISTDSISELICDKKRPDINENPVYTLLKSANKKEIIAGARYSFQFSPQKIYHPAYISIDGSVVFFKCFTTDTKGTLWGGNYAFLGKINPLTNIVAESHMQESRINTLYCDKNDTIWMGCLNGLWSYKDGKSFNWGLRNPLFKNRIEDIREGADHTWWFATKGNGVIVKKGDQISELTEKAGLASNLCKSLFLDSAGTVWVGTNNGISKVRMTSWGKFKIINYTIKDGLVSNQINQITKTGGIVWAATNKGVIAFDEKKALLNNYPPPVYITSIEINSALKIKQDSFKLGYSQNTIKISFVGLTYKPGSKLKYRYVLEGLDTSWSFTQNTSIQYTTLPPGEYRFKLTAINNDGVQSLKPVSFQFSISKPFWQTWWFRLLGFILVIGTGLTLGTYNQTIQKKKELEKSEITRKMAELKLMALSAQMNPHFLFNAINSIQLFILENDSKSAQKHLAKFSKLIRQVLENSKQEYVTIANEILTLKLYIELEALRFSSKFTCQVSVAENLPAETSLIPPLLIQPFVENAIWHGLMHLQNQRVGALNITLEKAGNTLKCIIEDNGIGRSAALLHKKEESHKPMGLSINQERITTLNALYNNTNTITIIDKFSESNLPLGTRVEIVLPYLTI